MIHPTAWVLLLTGSLMMARNGRPLPSMPVPGSYPANPLPAHTGAFGESSCHTCHFEGDVGAGGGSLSLTALPGGIVVVRLQHRGMKKAGFQLTARFADGTQAGLFTADGATYEVTVKEGIHYVSQTDAGNRVTDDAAVWRVQWEPPAKGAVRLHVSAVAGDGDESQFGDWVYLAELER